MSKVNLTKAPPRCPLCTNVIKNGKNGVNGTMRLAYDSKRNVFVYACDIDQIAIRTDDIFVGRWEQAAANAGGIDCPACNAKMRFFATSTGFMKAKCPKKGCGATMANGNVDDVPAVNSGEVTPETPGVLQRGVEGGAA